MRGSGSILLWYVLTQHASALLRQEGVQYSTASTTVLYITANATVLYSKEHKSLGASATPGALFSPWAAAAAMRLRNRSSRRTLGAIAREWHTKKHSSDSCHWTLSEYPAITAVH